MHPFPTVYRRVFDYFGVILFLCCFGLCVGHSRLLYGQATADPAPPADLAHHFYLPLIQSGNPALAEGEPVNEAQVEAAPVEETWGAETWDAETWDAEEGDPATAALVAAAAVTQIVPSSPECLTQFPPLVAIAEPTWRFVLNFNVWLANDRPVGCVLLNRTNQLQAFTALRVPCKRIGEVTPVTVSPAPHPSQANFTGGYFACPLNLQRSVNALGALDQNGTLIHFSAEYSYPQFTVLSRGALRPGSGSTLYANPLIAYQPANKKKPDLAFFAPLKPTVSTQAVLLSYYRSRVANRTIYRTNGDFAHCGFSLFTPVPPQIWGITRDQGSNQIRHTITGANPLCTFMEQPPLRFATNGGAFTIGYTALQMAQRLSGTLDEVLIDPPGSTKPPT